MIFLILTIHHDYSSPCAFHASSKCIVHMLSCVLCVIKLIIFSCPTMSEQNLCWSDMSSDQVETIIISTAPIFVLWMVIVERLLHLP